MMMIMIIINIAVAAATRQVADASPMMAEDGKARPTHPSHSRAFPK